MTESNGRVRAPAVAMVYQIYCFPALSDLFLSLIRTQKCFGRDGQFAIGGNKFILREMSLVFLVALRLRQHCSGLTWK